MRGQTHPMARVLPARTHRCHRVTHDHLRAKLSLSSHMVHVTESHAILNGRRSATSCAQKLPHVGLKRSMDRTALIAGTLAGISSTRSTR